MDHKNCDGLKAWDLIHHHELKLFWKEWWKAAAQGSGGRVGRSGW